MSRMLHYAANGAALVSAIGLLAAFGAMLFAFIAPVLL